MSDILERLQKEIDKYEAARMFCAPRSEPGMTEKMLRDAHDEITRLRANRETGYMGDVNGPGCDPDVP